MTAKRPWPWKAYAVFAVVGFGLLAVAIFDESWVGTVALIAASLSLFGWLAFLRLGGYQMNARERE